MASTTHRSDRTHSPRGVDAKQRRANTLLAVKSTGYLISMLSVVLLGVVSWKKASEEPPLLLCLIGGMATSVLGMFLRWISYEIEERRKARGED